MTFYSQNSPSWSSKPLGKSPYTVGNSGCLVTAIQNGLIRQGYKTDPGKFTDWGNLNRAFQDPKGFLIFDSVGRYTGGKYHLIDGNSLNKLNTLHEVIWSLKSGRKTTHWVDQDKGRDLLGFVYVIDSWDGQRKSLHQSFWQPTGRKAYIK